MITRIHKHCDHQTEDYEIGRHNVVSIERFNINGEYEYWPRLRVIKSDGQTIEMNEKDMTIYERKQND